MAQSTSTLLSYAFRPFFLLNGLFAIVVVLVWLAALHGYAFSGLPANPLLWHGHEMLIGFVMATVAGFSLTAVATWTGRPAVNGARLGWLVTAWLAGRLAMVLSGLLPGALTAVVDLLFPVMLCIFLGREVIGGRSRRNYGIVVVVALMALLNLTYHMGIGNLLPAGSERMSLYLLIHLVLLLLTIVAGRIVPNFTANWLRARGQSCQPRSTPLVDRATISGHRRPGDYRSPVARFSAQPLVRHGDHRRTPAVRAPRSLPLVADRIPADRLCSLRLYVFTDGRDARTHHGGYRQHDPGRDHAGPAWPYRPAAACGQADRPGLRYFHGCRRCSGAGNAKWRSISCHDRSIGAGLDCRVFDLHMGLLADSYAPARAVVSNGYFTLTHSG
jgi:hypothetical protein